MGLFVPVGPILIALAAPSPSGPALIVSLFVNIAGFDDVTAPRRHFCAKVGLR